MYWYEFGFVWVDCEFKRSTNLYCHVITTTDTLLKDFESDYLICVLGSFLSKSVCLKILLRHRKVQSLGTEKTNFDALTIKNVLWFFNT